MKLFRRRENLWSLLRQVEASEPRPAEGHLIEDDQLRTCWPMGAY